MVTAFWHHLQMPHACGLPPCEVANPGASGLEGTSRREALRGLFFAVILLRINYYIGWDMCRTRALLLAAEID
jgi:hypothetical protein